MSQCLRSGSGSGPAVPLRRPILRSEPEVHDVHSDRPITEPTVQALAEALRSKLRQPEESIVQQPSSEGAGVETTAQIHQTDTDWVLCLD